MHQQILLVEQVLLFTLVSCIMIILEGIVAEKQEEKLKAIIPQTNLNIVQ